MQSSTESYKLYGIHHGNAVRLDASNPDRDAFLAYMERRLPADGLDAYMDGFMAGVLGECKYGYRYLRELATVGSEVGG